MKLNYIHFQKKTLSSHYKNLRLFFISLICGVFTSINSHSQISKQILLNDSQTNNKIEIYDLIVNEVLVNKDSLSIQQLFIKDSLPKKIKIYADGYKPISIILSKKDTIIKPINLSPERKLFKTITIKKKNNLEFGKIDLSSSDIRKTPTFLGENDLIKSIQL